MANRALVAVFLATVGGCGTMHTARTSYGTGAPSARTRPAEAYSGVSESYSGAEAPGQVAGRARSSSSPSSEPAPDIRAGLGTEFGEQRQSRIRFVSFERASAEPFATAALNYNDPQGILAMVSHDMANGAPLRPVGVDPRGELTISIVDEYGQPLRALQVGARTYVIGQAGQRYAVAVQNHGAHRYEIVASVDGLDVMDGQEASVEKRGYIVEGFTSFAIEGFRTSAEDVAAFRFGSVRDSYAARTGSARNVGVIGVALFSERGVSYYDNEIHVRQSADPFPGRFSQPPQH